MTTDHQKEQAVWHKITDGLASLDDDARIRMIRTVVTYFGLERSIGVPVGAPSRLSVSQAEPSDISTSVSGFSAHPDLSPKAFLAEKQPRTDVDRVACLAYYLAHYGDTPHFKTAEINKVNTEAAQRKFSNAAYAVANTGKKGLIVAAGKGARQISAFGEHYVDAMPDREAVRAVVERHRHASGRRRAASKKKKRTAAKKVA